MVKIDLGMLGACGIYCATCDIHLAGKDGDVEAQTKIANWIVENCNTECRPDQIRCCGCWGALDATKHWSADCSVMKCARARHIKLCSDCGEYETCTTLEGFYQGGDYESARRALARIREIGLSAWVEERETEEVPTTKAD